MIVVGNEIEYSAVVTSDMIASDLGEGEATDRN
jgi:hypothetical protein